MTTQQKWQKYNKSQHLNKKGKSDGDVLWKRHSQKEIHVDNDDNKYLFNEKKFIHRSQP